MEFQKKKALNIFFQDKITVESYLQFVWFIENIFNF